MEMNREKHRGRRSLGRKFLFLVALLLDNAGLGRVLEIATGRDKGAPHNEDGDLCPRAVIGAYPSAAVAIVYLRDRASGRST
jgi:hypothetical protein